MRRFAVLRNKQKPESDEVTERIVGYFKSHGADAGAVDSGSEIGDDTACVLVLGGDGTLLRAAKEVLDRQIPLLGVNLGTLGYLAEIDIPSLGNAMDRLLNDDYTIESRMMIEGRVFRDGEEIFSDVALNDIVITRQKQMRTFRYRNYVNGAYLNTLAADGIIVSTPTGSTGYNLSTGGPIVSPEADIVVLSPIAPHSLISRSIILPGTDAVTVRIAEGKTGSTPDVARVSFDGSDGVLLGTDDSVEVRRCEKRTRFLKINQISFLDILRRKLADA